MAATFTWHIDHCERTASDGAVFSVRWRCDALQTQGEGADAVTYERECVGITSFIPDPDSTDFIEFDSLTENQVLNWVWSENPISKQDIETGLQDQLTDLFTPRTLSGVPW